MLMFASGKQGPKLRYYLEGVALRRKRVLLVEAQSRGLADLGSVFIPAVDLLHHTKACSLVTAVNYSALV